MTVTYTDKQVESLWEELENITFEDRDGELYLLSSWHKFEAGTSREDIWYWFDSNHSKGVGWLLNEYKWSDECDDVKMAKEVIRLDKPYPVDQKYEPNKLYIIGSEQEKVIRHEWFTANDQASFTLHCKCCGENVDTDILKNHLYLLTACYQGDRNSYYLDGFVDPVLE